MTAVFCTKAELERKLSAAGVLAFSDHDESGTADDGVVDDAIIQASQEIEALAGQRYSTAGMLSSELINRWCVTVAAYFLCQNRGNAAPASVESEFHRLMDPGGLLTMVASGKMRLPNVALRADMRPTFSNLKVDRGWPHSKVRVTRPNSSDAPTALTQDILQELPGYDR